MKLIFVYNAKSDLLNSTIGFAHKIISPSTYSCDLCSLTHGNFGERKNWKDFVKESETEMSFLHIDEFEKQFNTTFKYPVILSNSDGKLKTILSSVSISQIKDAVELINRLKENLGHK